MAGTLAGYATGLHDYKIQYLTICYAYALWSLLRYIFCQNNDAF